MIPGTGTRIEDLGTRLSRGVSEGPAQREYALAEIAVLDDGVRPDGFQQPGLVEQFAGVGDM